MAIVVMLDVAGKLQPEGRFAGAFFTEDNGSRWLRRIAKDLVPRRMVRALDAEFFEHRIGLRIFLRERIAGDAVVIQELLDFHAGSSRFQVPKFKLQVSSNLKPET